MILSALRLLLVNPHSLGTLYRCSLSTIAQDKPYHEKPFIRDCCNHKKSCTLLRPYSTIVAEISCLSFVWVSTRQLAGVPCPREFQAHSIFVRTQSAVSIALTWLLILDKLYWQSQIKRVLQSEKHLESQTILNVLSFCKEKTLTRKPENLHRT